MRQRIQQRHGWANLWVMIRSIPSEAVPAALRQSDLKVSYLPHAQGPQTWQEKQLGQRPWQEARPAAAYYYGHPLCRRIFSRTLEGIIMARLVVKADNSDAQVIELNLGINRLGRSSDSDFPLEHPTISAIHCELILANDGVRVRDCASTNGTFVDDQPVTEAVLAAGQTLRLGDLELLVETTEVNITIPKFEVPCPAPPVVLPDGSLICPRHPMARATHQCTHCREVLCAICIHRLQRRGGKILNLCPLCSYPCVPLGGEQKKKRKSLLDLWRTTVKLPFLKRPGLRKAE